MPNETEDYNNAVRAALPSGMTFSGDRYRYNNHSFSPYKLAAWYYYYILRTGGGVPTFSPASLFAASEPGVWYDPSDLTTLFTDNTGTTPVTATGQTVGLMLDKSKGLVLGSELVTNGTFDSGITGWTSGLNSPVLSWVPSGAMRVSRGAAAGFSVTTQSISGLVVGKTYLATAGFSAIASGLSPYVAINSVVSGTNRAVFRATATSHTLEVVTSTGSTGQSFDVDNISVKELAGFHATQATLASRPTYGIVPLGGRRNLLTRTEEFENAVWSNFGLAAFGSGSVVNAIAAPDGTVTADLLTENSSTSTHVSTRADGNFTGTAKTFSVHAKANGRRYIGVAAVASDVGQIGVFDLQAGTYIGAANGPSGGTGVNVVAASIEDKGNGWYRCSVSFDVASASRFPVLYLMNGTASANASYAGNGTAGILIWGAQLETGSSATAYQRVGSAFDVTEAGVASLSYLSFDGVDDFLITPTITPGIDRAQVFAGVRKLSDAAVAILVESSTSVLGNAGTFYLAAPESNAASDRYSFAGRGNAPLVIGQVSKANTGTAPDQAVITALGDIPDDSNIIRRNGIAFAAATGDQGTGNYLAYPLYIGRRGGTTLPFNGQLYSLIVRFGANLTTDTITSTETYVNGKTGAYT